MNNNENINKPMDRGTFLVKLVEVLLEIEEDEKNNKQNK